MTTNDRRDGVKEISKTLKDLLEHPDVAVLEECGLGLFLTLLMKKTLMHPMFSLLYVILTLLSPCSGFLVEGIDAPADNFNCVHLHEFVVFINRRDIEHNKDSKRFYLHVSGNGEKVYYMCRTCTRCGEGVRIKRLCQLHNDTVCSDTCIDPIETYDPITKTCGISSRKTASNGSPRSTRHLISPVASPFMVTSTPFTAGMLGNVVGTIGVPLSHEWEIIQEQMNSWLRMCLALTAFGVVSLAINVMVAILLVYTVTVMMHIKRDRKQAGKQVTGSWGGGSHFEQNNRMQSVEAAVHEPRRNSSFITQQIESVTIESPEQETTLLEIPGFTQNTSSIVLPTVDHLIIESNAHDNTASNSGTATNLRQDIGPKRIKVNNLNQDVPRYTPASVIAMDIQQPQTVNPHIQVKPGTEPYWIEISGYFGPNGGTLCCDQSDVIVEIPPGAIPATHPQQLITVKVSRTPGMFSVGLKKGGLFLSPLVDCESPGLKGFKKNITIKLPHRAHLNPDWQFVVHYTDDTSLSGNRGFEWKVVKGSCRETRRYRQDSGCSASNRPSANIADVQFTVDTKHVYITTPHFSKYTCSGCGTERELSFEAVVYINDVNLDATRRVDLHCYLLDSIKDFQRKVDMNEQYKKRTPHKPLIIDTKKGKEVEVSLLDMGEDCPWKIDDRVHKEIQMVNIDDLIRCHSDVVPDYTTFTLRPRRVGNDISQMSPNCLETHVKIKQKSGGKGITLDIAVNLDGGPMQSQGTTKDMEAGLMEVFCALSNKLTATQWKPLFRALMTSVGGCTVNIEATISFLENKDPRDLKEQIYSGFVEWYRMNGKYDTLHKLCNCLKREQLESLVEEVNDIYHQACVSIAVGSKSQLRSSKSFETTV